MTPSRSVVDHQATDHGAGGGAAGADLGILERGKLGGHGNLQ